MNQLVYRLARSEMNVDKLAVLLLRNTPCERDAIVDKYAGGLVGRYLLVVLGRERDRDALAFQLTWQRLRPRFSSSASASPADHRTAHILKENEERSRTR